jgi:MFS family permease
MAATVLARRDFRLLWGGQFVSNLGGQLTGLALPAAVVLVLGATPMEAGALQAVSCGVIPLLAMVAGVVVDRFPRRPMMIAANVVRGFALLTLPTAFVLHRLTLAHCFAVSFVCGVASIVYDTAFIAFFAMIVPRDRVADGNAKMAIGSSSAEAIGTSVAGVLIGALGAPLAIGFDALTHLIATLTLARIHCGEPPIERARTSLGQLGAELAAGVRAWAADPVLRAIGITSAASHFGGAMVMSVFFIYVYRDLNVSAVVLGVVLGCANLGVGGAFCAERIARRLGVRRTLTLATAAAGAANLLLPLCAPAAPLITIVAMRLVLTLCGPIFEVTAQTMRIARVSPEFVGRSCATNRTLVWGMLPLGSLCGGALGTIAGIGPTLVLGGTIALAASALMLTCPPIRDARTAVRVSKVIPAFVRE